MTMDIRNVQTFIRVAELGSFTQVARELNYVQSTVTMQIQQLERELGYPLFDRIGKKVSLTALGTEFLAYAYEITHLVQQAGRLGQESTDLRGTLRVGVLESLLFGPLTALLPTFRAAHPNIDLQLKMGQTSELLRELKENKLDMVYLSADLNTDPDLRCCYRRREERVFVAAPSHPLAGRENVAPSELFTYDFIVTERGGICYGRLRELAAQHNVLLRDAVEVDSTAVITELVAKGMGLAFLPAYAVAGAIADGKVVRVDADVPPQTYYSQILCHKSRWMSPFMTGLVEAVRAVRPEKE
jgi:DNA-binding transcriptional LysR family regulator